MRKIVLFINISLDGFISGPNNSLDWTIPDKQLHEAAIEWMKNSDLIMFGRITYQMMLDAWPAAEVDPKMPSYMVDFAKTLNPMKKIVFSKTLQKVGWNTTLIRDFNSDEIKKIQMQEGKNITIGGANLAQKFMQHGLIDEFQLLVHPVVLGSGKPLFNAKSSMNLELLKTKKFSSGVVMLYYKRK